LLIYGGDPQVTSGRVFRLEIFLLLEVQISMSGVMKGDVSKDPLIMQDVKNSANQLLGPATCR